MRLFISMRLWPVRRWVTAAVVAPVLAAVLAIAGGGGPWWGWPALVGISALAGLVVATYVPPPGAGRLIDVGCSPCATIAGGAVAVSLILRINAAASAGAAAFALFLLTVALVQRLADSTSCATPRPTRSVS